MSLKDSIKKDLITAMKASEKEKVATLRLLQSEIKQREIDQRVELGDPEIEKTLQTMIKQRNDSIDAFAKAGRQELVDKEQAEINVLQNYLPQPLTDDELTAIADSAISQIGADIKNMGQIIKQVMTKAGSRADGKRVSLLVKSKLS